MLLNIVIDNMKHTKHESSLAQLLPDERGESAQTIRRVVKIGCAVNALLMSMKLIAGYFGHSDALVADGFHSLNDLAADLIMLIFVGISYRAADSRYAYGYGKFETFSSFLVSAFLIIVACVIGVEAVESIVNYARGEELDQPDLWTFVVVLFAMACKEVLFHFYSHAAKKADSKALLANAWHHRSDALASVATLVGVTFSHFFGPEFRILDPIASLVIALFILIPAVRLFCPAFTELMEHSLPTADVERAESVVASVPGVARVSRLRTRRIGHHLVFDVDICVSINLTVGESSKIVSAIVAALRTAFCPHVLVAVSIHPVD